MAAQKNNLKGYHYLQCRTLGHSWIATEATRRPSFGFYMWLECSRCTMQRRDIIDLLGQVSSRYYVQPTGYKNPAVRQRMDYRRELVHQLVQAGKGARRKKQELPALARRMA